MRRALIIEDDANQRESLAVLLGEQGWEVVEAADGEAGVQAAQTCSPDLIFCDFGTQRSDGFQIWRTLRSDPALKAAFIVVTGGRVSEADRSAALEAGAHECLQKPVQRSHVGQLLQRIAPSQSWSPPATPGDNPSGDKTPTLIRFWGVRGSIPSPGPDTVVVGGNTSCVEIRADGQLIILDAGTGMRALGRQLVQEFRDQPLHLSLLLSHTHWDHIQGLPFFAPLYRPESHLTVYGYEGARSSLASVLFSQMESPFFPVGLNEVPSQLQIEELRGFRFSLGPVQVDALQANHPGLCMGYRLKTSGGTVGFFPDNEPPTRQQREGRDTQLTRSSATGPAHEQEARLIDFLRGIDLLIMDAQYTAKEYADHVGWGHGCVEDVVNLALGAKVGRLILFHHDPDHDDDTIKRMEARAQQLVKERGANLEVRAAREGLQLTLSRKG